MYSVGTYSGGQSEERHMAGSIGTGSTGMGAAERASTRHGDVHGVVPFVHVVNVEESIAFYERLGLTCTQRLEFGGETGWAWLTAGTGDLMLSRASGAIDAGVQAVLLYMYSDDVRALRERLIAGGVEACGKPGEWRAQSRRGQVFEVGTPHYMPEGELRVHDPDGYVVLIGQRG